MTIVGKAMAIKAISQLLTICVRAGYAKLGGMTEVVEVELLLSSRTSKGNMRIPMGWAR